jgi:hypothetical protein
MASNTNATDPVTINGTNENIINVISTKVDNTRPPDKVSNDNNELMDFFRKFIRENKTITIPEQYNKGNHDECKSECYRIMQEFLLQVKTYIKIKSVINLIDKNITTLKNVNIDGIDFLAEQEIQNPNPVDNNVNGSLFQDNVYQLLVDTYNKIPNTTWTCQYRRSELLQNRGLILEQMNQEETAFKNTANRLNEYLSRLMKYKARKSVFDFVTQGLDAL